MPNNKMLLSGLLFIFAFCFYVYVLYPTVAPRDSGELITGSYHLGISHPPGYPLYSLVGKVIISGIPFGNIAYRYNLLNALLTAGSIVIVFWLLITIFKLSLFFPFVFSLILSFNPIVINQAIQAEVFALNTLLSMTIILLIIYLKKTEVSMRRKYLYLIIFLTGISLGNQHIIILLLPIVLYAFLDTIKTNKFILFKLLFFILLGFTIYLYLPVRSHKNPILDIGGAETLKGFIEIITRSNYGSFALMSSGNNSWSFKSMVLYTWEIFKATGYIGIVLVVISISAIKAKTSYFKTIFIIFVLIGPMFLLFSQLPYSKEDLQIIERFFVLPLICVMIFVYYGIFIVLDKIKLFKKIIACLIFICLLVPLYDQFNNLNKRNCFIAYDYGKDILNSIKTPALLFALGDTTNSVLYYLLYVQNIKKDVNLFYPGESWWYLKQIKERYPELTAGIKDAKGFYLPQALADNNEHYNIYTTDYRLLKEVVPLGLVMKWEPKKRESPQLFQPFFFRKRHIPFYYDNFIKEVIDRYPTRVFNQEY